MSEDEKSVVRRFAEECWGQGAFDVADELVADEVVRNGQPVGRSGLVGVIAAIRTAFPDFHTEVEDLIAEGDRVAWRYSSGGVHTGTPLFGTRPADVPSTGQARRSCVSGPAGSRRSGTSSICLRSTPSSA